ncbi:hypothetical protein GCM10007377_12140 [Galliscardovia ingluviei]|uniref:Uncharacterized protein n=1 Tax=Galliscardovia ingluviei TaxID=1769422 RepID=A0A8J3AHQ3_9BIFI|nr:helix-turn-helix transcriptional regulator [Galliscardovia ingluviei]GGI14682.1 hypothetical protein GCM10007377_12140 [Galliscardovia ingluviei]
MARTSRQWTNLDKAAMQLVKELKTQDSRDMSMRTIAKEIGVTHPRVSALLSENGAPPTVDEFSDLCILFNANPGTVLTQALKDIGITGE